jgi:hypothetical protein
VGELLAAASKLQDKRQQIEAERRNREKARKEAEAAKARAEHLAKLASRQPVAWKEVDTLIATKQPGNYDRATEILRDLRDLAAQSGSTTTFVGRLADVHAQHARKPSLIQRLVNAGLTVS